MNDKDRAKDDVFFKAMGEIDQELLDHFDKNFIMTPSEKKKSEKIRKLTKNKLAWVAVCCLVFMSTNNSLVYDLPGGLHFEKKLFDSGFRASSSDITHLVYEERGDEIYYIFEGEEQNITEYCSDTDYFMAPVLNVGGTGYVVVIGGNAGERGFGISHYEYGEYLVGQWGSEIHGTDLDLWFYDTLTCPYPSLTWAHHSTHFLTHDLSEQFYQNETLPETIILENGTADKISDIGYHVKGYDLGFYVYAEAAQYVREELEFLRTEYGVEYSVAYPESKKHNEFGYYINVGDESAIHIEIKIDEQWTIQRELEIKAVLDDIGVAYILDFKYY